MSTERFWRETEIRRLFILELLLKAIYYLKIRKGQKIIIANLSNFMQFNFNFNLCNFIIKYTDIKLHKIVKIYGIQFKA